MDKSRRIAVFHADGTCIYDQPIEASPAAPSAKPHAITSDRLWPLIQVFVQFSREVNGGDVKRLVFRSPLAYAPTHDHFQPMSHPARPAPCIVVYLAHMHHFVVAVTERLVADIATEPALLAVADDNHMPVDTVPEFCAHVLKFLSQEENTFIASTALDDVEPHTSETPSMTQHTPSILSSHTSPSDASLSGDESSQPTTTPRPQAATIDTTKLSEFIARHMLDA